MNIEYPMYHNHKRIRKEHTCNNCKHFSDYKNSADSEIFLCLKDRGDEPPLYVGKDCTHKKCCEPYRCSDCIHWKFHHNTDAVEMHNNTRMKRFGVCAHQHDELYFYEDRCLTPCNTFEPILKRPKGTDITIVEDKPEQTDVEIIKDEDRIRIHESAFYANKYYYYEHTQNIINELTP